MLRVPCRPYHLPLGHLPRVLTNQPRAECYSLPKTSRTRVVCQSPARRDMSSPIRIRCICVATVSLILLLGTAVTQAQQTINVPAGQPTIQAAINAANNGETVLVAPGTYLENVNFGGKAITVASSGGDYHHWQFQPFGAQHDGHARRELIV